ASASSEPSPTSPGLASGRTARATARQSSRCSGGAVQDPYSSGATAAIASAVAMASPHRSLGNGLGEAPGVAAPDGEAIEPCRAWGLALALRHRGTEPPNRAPPTAARTTTVGIPTSVNRTCHIG